MDDPRLDEILERLEAIECALHDHLRDHDGPERGRHGGRGHRCGCHGQGYGQEAGYHGCCCSYHGHGVRGSGHRHGGGRRGRREAVDVRGQPFEEKRVVDLIVGLVTQRVEELFERYGGPPGGGVIPASEAPSESEDGTKKA